MTDDPTTATARRERRKRRARRPWPTVAVLLLLLGQVAGYLAITGFHLGLFAALVLPMFTMSFALVALAVGAFLAAVSNLLRAPSAWLNTMLVQGLGLAVALVLYLGERPYYTYLIMLYCVMVVVYLMLPGVQAAFVPAGDNRR